MRWATLSLDPDKVEGFGGIDATDDHNDGNYRSHHGQCHMPKALDGVGAIDPGGLDQILRDIGEAGIGNEGDEGCCQPDVGEGNRVDDEVLIGQPLNVARLAEQPDGDKAVV